MSTAATPIQLPDDLGQLRALVVGGGPGAADLAAAGTKEVVSHADHWSELSAEVHGTFGLTHCAMLIERETNPMGLLGRLWQMTAPGGTLLVGARVLDAPHLSRYLDFTTTAAGEHGWLPGRLALRWMVESSGFDAGDWLSERPDALGRFPTARCYLRASRTGRAPLLP